MVFKVNEVFISLVILLALASFFSYGEYRAPRQPETRKSQKLEMQTRSPSMICGLSSIARLAEFVLLKVKEAYPRCRPV